MANYTVRNGDSLSIIARDVLGNLSRWSELAALNAIAPPYTIYPGQVLTLPNVTGGAAGSPIVTPPGASMSIVTGVPWYRRPWVWFAVAGMLAFATWSAESKTARRRRV